MKKNLFSSIIVLFIVIVIAGFIFYIKMVNHNTLSPFTKEHCSDVKCHTLSCDKSSKTKQASSDKSTETKQTSSDKSTETKQTSENLEKLLSDEDFANKSFTDMEIVDREIDHHLDKYKNKSTEKQKELLLELLYDLAENGTKDAPYSLIDKDSICYTDDCISFSYAIGISGGILLKDFGSSPCDYID